MISMNTYARQLLLFAAVGLLPLQGALAASVNHGDFDDIGGGGTVAYEDVTESTNLPTVVLPIYGVPTVTGNTINFNPLAFGLSSGPGVGGGFLDVALQFDIRAIAGETIESFFIEESGVYSLENISGPDTSTTFVEVSAPWNLVILATTQGPLQNPVIVQGNLTFTPVPTAPPNPAAHYTLDDDPGTDVAWQGEATIDITAELLLAGITDEATLVDFSMDNILIVASQDGTIASITKEDVTGVTMTVDGPPPVIPEPSTLVLCGLLAVVALARIWRRRRCAAASV